LLHVCVVTVWRTIRRLKLTFKKNGPRHRTRTRGHPIFPTLLASNHPLP
jgi:hypothetical protein